METLSDARPLTLGSKLALGLQHVFAMFGATVLVPALTGLDPSLALLCAGLGTLLFHLCTKGKVPVFLGSSFAFIGAIALLLSEKGIGAVKTGVIAAGSVYVLFAGLVRLVGSEKVRSFFPPIVTGPVVIVIGLRLAPIAVNNALYSNNGAVFEWKFLVVAAVVVLTMILVSMFAGGFFKLVPILIAIVTGFVAAWMLGLVSWEAVQAAPWFGFSTKTLDDLLTLPTFEWSYVLALAPIAIVVFVEHMGDITTNGAVVGKDFFKDPGLHRTLLGDGTATVLAGLLGGPANTTYSENTGVLAVTKVYNPVILRIAACFAIALSLLGKVGALVTSMPGPVMGGVSIILFGMIASVGVRIMVDAKLDFAHSRNLIIASIILVLGIGIGEIGINESLKVSGLAIAALLGIILNKVLPENR